jgi:hypothetical protein
MGQLLPWATTKIMRLAQRIEWQRIALKRLHRSFVAEINRLRIFGEILRQQARKFPTWDLNLSDLSIQVKQKSGKS